MKYVRPVVMSLGERAGAASGDKLLGCVAGDVAAGTQTCAGGGSATRACFAGGTGTDTYESCTPGSAADAFGDCLSGTVVYEYSYCEAGTGGSNDPYGCNVGPSFT